MKTHNLFYRVLTVVILCAMLLPWNSGSPSGMARAARLSSSASASLGPWSFTSSLVTGRYTFGAAAWGNYIYVLGGTNSSGILNSVERATINPDGSLGTWQTIGTLPTARTCHKAVAVGGYLYVLGGLNSSSQALKSVEYAAINADGSLGTWHTASSMTVERYNMGVVSANGYLYAIGGSSASVVLSSVEYARINANGTLGNWQTTSSLSTARVGINAVAANGYIYAPSGGNASGKLSSVEYAAIQAGGSLGVWQSTRSLNTARMYYAAVTDGSFVYVLAGSAYLSNTGIATVEVAAIKSDHSLDTWQTANRLQQDKFGLAAIHANGYIYAIGGHRWGVYLASVERASVGGNDTTPPAAITNLSASTGSTVGTVNLSWTAPGDDGSTGTATQYIVRYNTVQITEANWASSTDVSGEPTPGPAGSAQGMTVSGLTPGQRYYFAIKTQDEVPNTSGISNSPSAVAGGSDRSTKIYLPIVMKSGEEGGPNVTPPQETNENGEATFSLPQGDIKVVLRDTNEEPVEGMKVALAVSSDGKKVLVIAEDPDGQYLPTFKESVLPEASSSSVSNVPWLEIVLHGIHLAIEGKALAELAEDLPEMTEYNLAYDEVCWSVGSLAMAYSLTGGIIGTIAGGTALGIVVGGGLHLVLPDLLTDIWCKHDWPNPAIIRTYHFPAFQLKLSEVRGACPDKPQEDICSRQTCPMTGIVYDALIGGGVEGAYVIVQSGPAAATDSSGGYTMTAVPVGWHMVTAKKEGYVDFNEIVNIDCQYGMVGASFPLVPIDENATVTLQAYAADYDKKPKYIFSPGQAIQLMFLVENHGDTDQTVSFDWDTTNPNSFPVSYLSWHDQTVSLPPGEQTWWLTRGLAHDAPIGTYIYHASASYGTKKSVSYTTFHALGDAISINMLESLTCKDVDEEYTYLPIDETSVFTTDDEFVWVWSALEGASGSHTVEWKWYRPDGTLLGTSSYNFNATESLWYTWCWGRVSCMQSHLGQWHVDIYVDGSLADTVYFTLKAGTQLQATGPSVEALGTSGSSPTGMGR